MANPTINNIAASAAPAIGSYLSPAGSLRKRWLYHLLFWIVYYLFISLMFFSFYGITRIGFYLQLLLFFPLEMVLIYLNFYVLMPRYLFARRYVHYILFLLPGIVAVAAANTGIQIFYHSLGYKEFAMGATFSFSVMMGRIFEIVYLVGFTGGVKLARNWMFHLQWIKEKEKQYLETELNFLKSQIQPHFFFNTLNNLYSLTLKKSDQAPEVVLKLSDLMSYMLYESGSGKVALDKEIAYLQNYIDVEKLRFGHRLDVVFETEGRTESVSIPPMVLILFVENSFKHGVKNNVNQISICISLKVDEGYLYFRVTNPVSMAGGNTDHEGIGLKNVRRRLDLLFGKNYVLNTEERENKYFVSLKIPVW